MAGKRSNRPWAQWCDRHVPADEETVLPDTEIEGGQKMWDRARR
jgi:hypothetical protein